MVRIEAYFDDRLYGYGIDYLAWDGVGQSDHQVRGVTLRFADDAEGTTVEIEQRLVPNSTETEYRSIVVNECLRRRGMTDIFAKVYRDAAVHADIYLTIKGEATPLRVTKQY